MLNYEITYYKEFKVMVKAENEADAYAIVDEEFGDLDKFNHSTTTTHSKIRRAS